MNCGFNCIAKCHQCDASDWHNFREDAEWRATIGENRSCSPYKEDANIPLLDIPGVDAMRILPDSCHCFHLGWGVDLAASGLVLLCKRRMFEGRALDKRLADAYSQFLAWCAASKKTTAIQHWSYKKLDMNTNLEPTSFASLL